MPVIEPGLNDLHHQQLGYATLLTSFMDVGDKGVGGRGDNEASFDDVPVRVAPRIPNACSYPETDLVIDHRKAAL